jgi:hypothetical protein
VDCEGISMGLEKSRTLALEDERELWDDEDEEDD